MEGLAAAASGIAVVSLAIQLAESVKKLCEFWDSIKEAPEDIQAMSRDLELLSSVLTQIAHEAQHVEPDSTLVPALNGCWNKVKTLTKLLKEIEPGFASTSPGVRKWTALKAVSKHGQLVKFQEAVERLKSTLLLVQQNQYSRSSRNWHLSLERKLDTITRGVSSSSLSTVSDGRNRHLSLERKLDTITQSVSSLSMEQYSNIAERVLGTVSDVESNRAVFNIEERDATKNCAGNLPRVGEGNPSNSDGSWRKQAWVKRTLREQTSVMEYFLGTICAESNTKLRTARETDSLITYREEEQYEHETSYTIYPATWLIRLGLHYGLRLRCLSSSTQGWKNTLETLCPVPDDALIFEFCKEGNVPAVRRLLAGGHASVRDTDSQGYTPLHFAAQNHHPEVCRILKAAGADMGTLTHQRDTAILLAADKSMFHTTYATLSEIFDTLRLLTDSMDFSDESGNGWLVLWTLCVGTEEGHGETEAKIALLLWTLKLSSFELKTYPVRSLFARMLGFTLKPHPGLEEASDWLLNIGGAETLDANRYDTEGYTLLQESIAFTDIRERTSTILARGPDLHRLGLDTFYTPQEETPTSLAMYSEWAFEYWACGLNTIEVDLEKFIEQELERNHVVHVGWEKETLLDLFTYDYTPDLELRRFWTCSDCTKREWYIRVQPYWRHLLERIKRKIDPDTPAQDHSEAGETENAGLGGIVEAASSSSDLAQKFDVSEKIPFADPGELPSGSESESVEDIHGYPTTIPIQSDCMYARHEVVCMGCWIHYRRTGTRNFAKGDSSMDENFPSRDEPSEDDYSPYLIHT